MGQKREGTKHSGSIISQVLNIHFPVTHRSILSVHEIGVHGSHVPYEKAEAQKV